MMAVCNNPEQAEKLKEEIQESRSTDLRHVIELCEQLEEYARRTDDRELLGYTFFYRGGGPLHLK